MFVFIRVVGKQAFLEEVTEQNKIESLELDDTSFEGSSPPSVFIGQHNYPKVDAGPMLSEDIDSSIYDMPEEWLGEFNKDEIVNLRLNLLRGKKEMNVKNTNNRFAQKIKDMALSKESVYSHASFEDVPRGSNFDVESQPFGPSADLKSIDTDNQKWHKRLEKAHYDYDLLAENAIVELKDQGLPFSRIQKALSTGAFGEYDNRKLVPTRWSITATDDALGKHYLDRVREYDPINKFRVYESNGLENNFSILLTPTPWKYEAIEAFIGVLNNSSVHTFTDYERHSGKNEYSNMGGCYYAQKHAVADFLDDNSIQAGSFVFREAYPDYTPTGVWVCRELTHNALSGDPKVFDDINDALRYIDDNNRLNINRFKNDMPLLQKNDSQRTLNEF